MGLCPAAVGGELPVFGVVAGPVGWELADGAHDFGAEAAQLRGDGFVGETPVWVKRRP
jgi:hypothetical protein